MADRSSTGKLHPVYRVLSGIIFSLGMIGLGALLRSMWSEGIEADPWPLLLFALFALAFFVAILFVTGCVLFTGRQPSFMDRFDKL